MKQDKPIIQTLMDTDRYKLSMQKAFLHNHPGAYARYRFKCRSESVYIGKYVDEIREEIKSLDSLTFTQEELDYIKKSLPFQGIILIFYGSSAWIPGWFPLKTQTEH